MSLNGALALASNSLELYSLGIQIAGQNISNATTPGYIREELVLDAASPYRVGAVVVGGGARAIGVQQVLDRFLEDRIHRANSDAAAGQQRVNAYESLEIALQEFSENDLSTSLTRLVNELQAVINQPDDPALRSSVIQAGSRYAQELQTTASRLSELQVALNDQVQSVVDEVNTLLTDIEKLNGQITSLEANGLYRSDAGGLRVQRLNALNRLSEIIPVRAVEQPSGFVDVYSGSEYLILSGTSQRLQTISAVTSEGVVRTEVEFTKSNLRLQGGSGQLGGLLDGRDKVFGGFIDQLDRLAAGVISTVNKIHTSGEGIVGYEAVTGTEYVADPSAALNKAGLAFPPQNGSFEIKVRNKATGLETVTRIAIDLDGIGTETSLNDLETVLNGIAGVTAAITPDGRLKLTADAGSELRFANDTSGILAGLGINTFFSGSTSTDIRVNQLLVNNQELLATGTGGGPGDNRNLVALQDAFGKPQSSLDNLTVARFYEQIVGNLAASSATEKAVSGGYQSYRDTLKTQREQISGVSLDEEAIRIMNLQRNYQAAAKIVSAVDELLNTLLNI